MHSDFSQFSFSLIDLTHAMHRSRWYLHQKHCQVHQVLLVYNRSIIIAHHLHSSGWLVHVIWSCLWHLSCRALTKGISTDPWGTSWLSCTLADLAKQTFNWLLAVGDVGPHPIQWSSCYTVWWFQSHQQNRVVRHNMWHWDPGVLEEQCAFSLEPNTYPCTPLTERSQSNVLAVCDLG